MKHSYARNLCTLWVKALQHDWCWNKALSVKLTFYGVKCRDHDKIFRASYRDVLDFLSKNPMDDQCEVQLYPWLLWNHLKHLHEAKACAC